MKLFIQIPCFNEEMTLPLVLSDLPRKIEGIDEIYTLVIDDGSTDNTVEVAKKLGIDYILKNGRNLGLAASYSRGVEACLFLGADIIVNTDGDNQYQGADIKKLVKPILCKECDIVVGCRNINEQSEFSWVKKVLQRLGSRVVRHLSKADVPDAPSGFRAVSRMAAIRLSVMNGFSYTIEMLIQAGRTGLKVGWVPIRTNPKTRKSRLFESNVHFIFRQLKIIFVAYLFYCPIRFFGWLALISFAISITMASRIAYFLWLSPVGQAKFKTGSGVLLLFSSIVCVVFLIAGLLGSVLSGLRFLMNDVRSRIRNIELRRNIIPHDLDIVTAPEFFGWYGTTAKPDDPCELPKQRR